MNKSRLVFLFGVIFLGEKQKEEKRREKHRESGQEREREREEESGGGTQRGLS